MKKNKPTTFAQRAKDIMKKYGYNEKTGKFLREDDPITQSSMNMELSKLREEQEVYKSQQEAEALRNGDMGSYTGEMPMGVPQEGGMPMGEQPMMEAPMQQGQEEIPMMDDGGYIFPRPKKSSFFPSVLQPTDTQFYSGIGPPPPPEIDMTNYRNVDWRNYVSERGGYGQDPSNYNNAVFTQPEIKASTPYQGPGLGLNSVDISVPMSREAKGIYSNGDLVASDPYIEMDISPNSVNLGDYEKSPGLVGYKAPDMTFTKKSRIGDLKDRLRTTGNNLKESYAENPYLWNAAMAQGIGTLGKAIYYGTRDQYDPVKYTPTEIPGYEAIDNSEQVKGIRSSAAGAKSGIRRGTGSRGELYGNLNSLNANEMEAVARAEEANAVANTQAKNAYNMQVAQIKMQDAERKLKTGMINKEAYDQITANWMGVMNESISGLTGIMRDMNANQQQDNILAMTGNANFGTIQIGRRSYRVIKGENGEVFYINKNGKKVIIDEGQKKNIIPTIKTTKSKKDTSYGK